MSNIDNDSIKYQVRFSAVRSYLFLALSVLAFLPASVACGAEWQWQHPTPQGNTLWKVAFADERYGFAVGDAGTILATRDGGLTWLLQYEGVTDNLRDLAVMDSLTAWIVGDNGIVMHTSNGGVAWNEQSSGTVNGLNAVYFWDGLTGWAAGDAKTIIRTSDGGATWRSGTLPTGQGNGAINAVVFRTSSDGWAAGSGGAMGAVTGNLYRSSDGGASWTLAQTLTGSPLRMRFLPDGLTGCVVGSGGLLLVTTNGGGSWSQTASGTSKGLNDILFSSASEFWIVGDDSTLLHSTTSGVSWSAEPFRGTYASVNGMAKAGAALVAVGEFGFLARRVLNADWTYLNSGNHPSINWLAFSDQMNGVAVGQWGYILRTTNGGAEWQRVDNGLTGDSFYGASYAGEHIWVVGDLGVLLHSSDRGLTWVQQSTYTTMTLLSISFTDQLHGWAAGDNGTLIHTEDGGAHWTAGTSGTTSPLYGIEMRAGSRGWVVGEYGTIRHTENSDPWFAQTSPVTTVLWSASFVDDLRGYAAGGNGVILRTTDGGSTWAPATTGTSRNVFVASGTAGLQVVAVGDTGLILRSTDGGFAWSGEFAKTEYDLFGLRILDDTVAWVAGDNGTILLTGTPHRSPTSVPLDGPATLPEQMQLEQNYPNPFNGLTHIGYSVGVASGQSPVVSLVRLVVYDLLGRDVAVLMDEEKAPGSYSVQFNASGLASGVYVYRLSTSNGTLSRKMLLLR
jgi:photosystem II stability/assembly factor-like uncharacterized protein